MTIRVYALSEDVPPPREIFAEIACDGAHGLFPVRTVLPAGWWPNVHRRLMREGWSYTPGSERVHLCGECSGKGMK